MADRLHFDIAAAGAGAQASRRRSPEAPFRILVLADLGGPDAIREEPLDRRRLHAVDLDTFDGLFHRLAPRVRLGEHVLTIASLDGFHPDTLDGALPDLARLADLRRRLADPATFAAAAAELGTAGPPTAPPPAPAADGAGADGPAAPAEDDAATLDRLLGHQPERPAPPRAGVDLDALIGELVAPHIVPDADPRQDLLLAGVAEASARRLGEVLHDPRFQQLEASWRALDWLVRELELGEVVELHLLDVSWDEVRADLQDARDAGGEPALARRLLEPGFDATDGPAWSVIVADHGFGPGPEDLALLAGLGAVAAMAGTPLLGGGRPELLGLASFAGAEDPATWSELPAADAERWRALRHAPVARWLGLLLPRVLLRLPYGERTDPVEAFPFTELPGGAPPHEALLWGNPAHAGALMLARGHTDRAAGGAGDDRVLDDLPGFAFEQGGETALQAVVEARLGDRAASRVLALGPIPLLGLRNRNALMIGRLQNLADPPTALPGI